MQYNFMAVGFYIYIYTVYAARFLSFTYDVVQVHSGNKHSTSNWIKKIRGKYYWHKIKCFLIMMLNNLVSFFFVSVALSASR